MKTVALNGMDLYGRDSFNRRIFGETKVFYALHSTNDSNSNIAEENSSVRWFFNENL